MAEMLSLMLEITYISDENENAIELEDIPPVQLPELLEPEFNRSCLVSQEALGDPLMNLRNLLNRGVLKSWNVCHVE